jgi:hypothetical protein
MADCNVFAPDVRGQFGKATRKTAITDIPNGTDLMTFPSPRSTLLRLLLAIFSAIFFAALAGIAIAADRDVRDLASPVTRVHGDIDDNDRVTLTGNRHPRLARAKDKGRADDALRIDRMILSLAPDASQSLVLERYLNAAHDPASPHYHQWLSTQEFERQFGISDQDIAKITQWLAGQGFTVDEIPAGRRSIVFSGSVAQVSRAFRTEMHHFRVDNEDHLANASDPQIPEALSAVVDGVVSLHNFYSRPLHANVKPAPDYTSGTSHAMAPADFYTIYNLNPVAAQSINGVGRSIAILGRTNILSTDIQQFQTSMGLPANLPQVIITNSNPGRVTGDEGESDLDLEWAGAVAPGATIKFITSKSTATTDGIDLSAQYAVSNNVADVISLSYGACEKDLGTSATNFYNGLWQQATAQGITVFVSSGDSGAAGCDSGSATTASTKGLSVNGLCSSPYSTCVGGTQFNDTANPSLYWASGNTSNLGSALSYIPEVVWNESANVSGGSGLWASSGGVSSVFAKPSWQTGLGVPADGKRDVPDVSLSAAGHDGYLVYSSDNTTSTRTLYTFGGTSASAPSFAGIMALINQKTGARQGNANPRFYQLSAGQASGGPATYHLITSGNNSVPGLTGYSASASTPYYNLATGLGSVDGNVLVNNWSITLANSATAITINPASATFGQSVTISATVTGNSPTGTVQFKDGASNIGSPVTLGGGAASLSTSALTVGSHTITAVYSGDSVNSSSVSPGVSVAVAKAPSAISLTSTSTSITQGQSVTFTATVSGNLLSGTIGFMDGSTSLGVVAINACTATLTTSALSAGTHNITAVYSGDANNQGSTSTVLTETVTPIINASSTSLSASTTSLTAGQSVTLTATVTGSSPTGTVQFKDGATALGSPVALNTNQASLSTNLLSVGSHSITAVFSGDAANSASTSSEVVINVTTVVSALSLTSSKATSSPGESVTFTATVSGQSPSGSVQFKDGSTSLGSATINAGIATFSTTALSAGTHSITAAYSGDAYNSASVSAAITQTVATSVITSDSGDVPTLPEWAALVMALILMARIKRQSRA